MSPKLPSATAILAACCILNSHTSAQQRSASPAEILRHLTQQGVLPSSVLSFDEDGVPLTCGTTTLEEPAAQLRVQTFDSGLPAGTREWECIPGVIRNDGIDSFVLEVNTNGPVERVTIGEIPFYLLSPTPAPFDLHDDGEGVDRVAGDFIFTGGPFTADPALSLPEFYFLDPTSPSGLWVEKFDNMNIEELDGTISQFVVRPQVGLLRSDIEETASVEVSSQLAVSPHLINVLSEGWEVQGILRSVGGNIPSLTIPIYDHLPDVIDFFLFFSTNHISLFPDPRLKTSNYIAGLHGTIRVNYTGTGLFAFDNSGDYGSSGRLSGINALDILTRGVNSATATHELVHQWASYTNRSLGLTDETGAHYKSRSSVGSLVGGTKWIQNLDGSFTVNCEEGRGGAHLAPPLDKYMMGLIEGSQVPPLYVYDDASPGPGAKCAISEPVFAEEIVDTVTIEEIQDYHGVRTPGPAGAQRHFAIAFVAESHDRLLTPTEMTFYEILAEHYTANVLAEDPDPYVGPGNWAPVTRFFGDGVTWSSRIEAPFPIPVELSFLTAEALPNAIRLRWATASETNNSGFEVERSVDRQAFVKIGFVQGKGTTSLAQRYAFDDREMPPGVLVYRLKQLDGDGSFHHSRTATVRVAPPGEYVLLPCFPNPFNPGTTIRFRLPQPSRVTLTIFNLVGQQVRALVTGEERAAGRHQVFFDGRSDQGVRLSSGVYMYRLEAGSYSASRKMILLE